MLLNFTVDEQRDQSVLSPAWHLVSSAAVTLATCHAPDWQLYTSALQVDLCIDRLDQPSRTVVCLASTKGEVKNACAIVLGTEEASGLTPSLLLLRSQCTDRFRLSGRWEHVALHQCGRGWRLRCR